MTEDEILLADYSSGLVKGEIVYIVDILVRKSASELAQKLTTSTMLIQILLGCCVVVGMLAADLGISTMSLSALSFTSSLSLDC